MRRYTDPVTHETLDGYKPLWRGFMAPPHRPVIEDRTDEVSAWFAVHGAGYEMGTWYTMIAGLVRMEVDLARVEKERPSVLRLLRDAAK